MIEAKSVRIVTTRSFGVTYRTGRLLQLARSLDEVGFDVHTYIREHYLNTVSIRKNVLFHQAVHLNLNYNKKEKPNTKPS